jgi:hypothetical protein
MGRKQQTQPPIPATTIREAFHVRQDGQIVRRSTGEIATFSGPGAQLLVRVYHQGCIRRFAAGRIAWVLATGEWPKGVVRCRNGVDDDLRPENLIVVKAGAHPFDQARGGKASSLVRRAKTTTTLINALAGHPGATVPQLSRLVGSSAPCVCTRLGKLSDMGLTCGPMRRASAVGSDGPRPRPCGIRHSADRRPRPRVPDRCRPCAVAADGFEAADRRVRANGAPPRRRSSRTKSGRGAARRPLRDLGSRQSGPRRPVSEAMGSSRTGQCCRLSRCPGARRL